jgi:hypothetical protein
LSGPVNVVGTASITSPDTRDSGVIGSEGELNSAYTGWVSRERKSVLK